MTAREEEESKCWVPPPPEPEPAQLVPKTPHSCQIGLRQLADTIEDIRKGGKRQTLIIDLSGNAQTFLRCDVKTWAPAPLPHHFLLFKSTPAQA